MANSVGEIEYPDDEIEKVECGWKSSCFLTKKHQLYLSESIEKKQSHIIPEEEKHKKGKKEEKKNPEKMPERTRWTNITPYFEQLKLVFLLFLICLIYKLIIYCDININIGFLLLFFSFFFLLCFLGFSFFFF